MSARSLGLWACVGVGPITVSACNSDSVLRGDGQRQSKPDDDTGSNGDITTDAGDSGPAWQPYGDPPEGWPDYDCEPPYDGSATVDLGHVSDGLVAGFGYFGGQQDLHLWVDGWACVGKEACDAGAFETQFVIQDGDMTTADGGRRDGRDGRWLGPHGPADWGNADGANRSEGPCVYVTLANGYYIDSCDSNYLTVEGTSTLCLIRATPRQFAMQLTILVAPHDAEYVGIGDGTSAVTLLANFDFQIDTPDISFMMNADPEHGPTTDEHPVMLCNDVYHGYGIAYGLPYNDAWPWEQLTDPAVHDAVYDEGKPCNWVP